MALVKHVQKNSIINVVVVSWQLERFETATDGFRNERTRLALLLKECVLDYLRRV